MTRELVEIQPTELKFIYELKKQSSCSVQLVNTSDQHVAYKVKTTNPKRYCVRPNVSVIYPNSPCEIIVTMQAPRSMPSDMQCRDKFLIQSTVVKERTTTEQISSDLFVKEHGGIIEEKKLKVTFISPPNSPTWQPTEDIIKHEALHKADSPVLQSSNTVKVREAVYGSPSIRQPLDIVTGKEIGYEAPSPVSQFFDSAKEHEFLHEAVSPVSQLVDSVKKQEFVYQTHSPVLRPINEEKPAFEALNPRDQVHSFTESSSPKLSQTVVKEVDGLKAKLHEAEKMIAHLREETSATTQERDALRHELRKETNRKRKDRIPVGYPFYFVFFTALVALLVGYMLHP